ncbi:hypothetical protein [Bartonella florencae]|uniref:hypothetical protein n=1 Tax=Bartonella florencae TaxID=928210 RepID=UPI0002F9809E|nr:hypothetical protein [Bartonella florencae]
MTIDKPQDGSLKRGEAVAARGAFDKAAKLFFFKKAMALSTKDYVIICCLAVLLLLFFVLIAFINPIKYFQVISEGQFKALADSLQRLTQATVVQQIFAESAIIQTHVIELCYAAGWNGFWAFLCFMPVIIFACALMFFPLFFIFSAVLKRELKEMIQQWEKAPKLQDNNHSAK